MSGRIALLLPDLRSGGAQRVLLVLAKAFLEKGAEVDVVVGLKEGGLLSEVPCGVRLVALCDHAPAFGRGGLALVMLLRLRRYLVERRPDALLSTLSGTNLVAAMACRMTTVPTRLVLREASRLVNLRHGLYRLLMRKMYSWADMVVALTSEMKVELQQVLLLPQDRVVQIPNPVDVARLERDARVLLPEGSDYAHGYLLAVGRLSAPKDYSTLIKAFARVARESEVKLVILGEGPDRRGIEALIDSLGVVDRVELRGYDANPYRWMARALLFVHSSCWEGYPNVIVEAQVLRLPVVATEYDASVRTLVREPGRIVPVGDEVAMGDAIRAILAEQAVVQGGDAVPVTGVAGSGRNHLISTKYGNDAVERYYDLLIPG